tara:strand:- start:974 stop:1147 length:174 start_codon:yes stop_codon:yes gene_type:complete
MAKATFLSNGADEDCEICTEQAVTVIIRERSLEVRCCDECTDIAHDKLIDNVVGQFG